MSVDLTGWELVPLEATPRMLHELRLHADMMDLAYAIAVLSAPRPPIDVASVLAERDALRIENEKLTRILKAQDAITGRYRDALISNGIEVEDAEGQAAFAAPEARDAADVQPVGDAPAEGLPAGRAEGAGRAPAGVRGLQEPLFADVAVRVSEAADRSDGEAGAGADWVQPVAAPAFVPRGECEKAEECGQAGACVDAHRCAWEAVR